MTDVYFADQACYINEKTTVNRDHAVCFGIQNAVKLFAKTCLHQYHVLIKAEGVAITEAINAGQTIVDKDFPFHPYTIALVQEKITDDFLIGTFFELVAKSMILQKGNLVHKINSKSAPTGIKALAKNQYREPINADSYALLDPFADYKNVGRNGMRYLKTSTLDYGWIYKNDYLVSLPFTGDFSKTARAFQVLRNQIHFPLAGAGEDLMELEMDTVDVHQVIMTEINTTIRPLFDSLVQKYSFNFQLDI
jgi:hypothetical protein